MTSSFLEAISSGDVGKVGALIALPPSDSSGHTDQNGEIGFERYVMNAAPAYNDLDREQMLAEVSVRAREHERFGLLQIAVDRAPAAEHTATGYYVLTRAADDLAAPQVLLGKFGANCVSHTFYAWLVEAQGPAGEVCPLPSGWVPTGPVVACSRRGPNAPAASTSLRLPSASTSLPRLCGTRRVAARVERMLGAFDVGDGQRFAAAFSTRPRFAVQGFAVARSRGSITRLVTGAYSLGVGWTLDSLKARGGGGTYRAVLRLTRAGVVGGSLDAQISFDCGSGLVLAWSVVET